MDERTLQQLVSDLCGWLGLYHYHPRISVGSARGWPDSVIVGTRMILRELKSEFGRLTPEQRDVGARLRAAGQDWAIWRPSQWLSGEIERELRLLKAAPMLPFDGPPGEKRAAVLWMVASPGQSGVPTTTTLGTATIPAHPGW